MFGAAKLTKNADPDKGFDSCLIKVLIFVWSLFSLPGPDWGKIVFIFGGDNSFSMHVDNKKKEILVLGEGPTQRWEWITITAEAKILLIFTDREENFV